MGKGFSHHFTEEDLKKWAAVPAKAKLEWLEEINQFIYKYTGTREREAISRFRKAEI